MRIIGVGDNVCDVYVDSATMYPGGQALNVSVFAAMLGISSAYLGAFGDDAVARHVQSALKSMGVEALRCRTHPGENGYALVTHDQGDRIFLGSNRGGVLRKRPLLLGTDDLDAMAGFAVLHTSNNSYLDGMLPALHALPTKVSYDFSGAWRDTGRVRAVAPYVDYAFLSLKQEEHAMLAQTAQALHAVGVSHVVMTMGAAGAWYSDGTGLHHQMPHKVQAVDTLGAGDSFAAAFLVHHLQGDTPAASMEKAAAFSAQCCLTAGAFGYPRAVDAALLRRMQANALPPQSYAYKPDGNEKIDGGSK